MIGVDHCSVGHWVDQQAQQELREGAAAAWDYYVGHPENLAQLLGGMSPDVREALAQAYERGDAEAAGKLLGGRLLDVPISPAGTVGKVGKSGQIVKPGPVGKAAQNVVPGVGAKKTQAPNASTVASTEAGVATNPLLADAIPRNGYRLVLNQGNVPTCGANSCGMALDTMGKPVDVATLIQRVPPRQTG